MRISDWSSDVCSSDLACGVAGRTGLRPGARRDAATLCAWRGSMTRVLMPFPADAVLAGTINQPLQARIAPVAWRHFPDGESLVTLRSEEHTSELQSLMRNSYAVFCLKKKNT